MTDPASRSDTPPPRDPFRRRPKEPLFNRFPAVVAWLSAVIVAVTAVQLAGPMDARIWLYSVGALVGGPGFEDLTQPLGPWPPLVLHVFLHGGWLHLIVNMGAMASFGPPVAQAMGRGPRGAALFLAFFFVCAVAGGLAQLGVFASGLGAGLAIGASSALSGLLPAVGWLQGGIRGAVRLSAPWLVINIILAVTEAAVSLPIAWAAHLGGLAAGFLLFPVFLSLAPRRGPWGARY